MFRLDRSERAPTAVCDLPVLLRGVEEPLKDETELSVGTGTLKWDGYASYYSARRSGLSSNLYRGFLHQHCGTEPTSCDPSGTCSKSVSAPKTTQPVANPLDEAKVFSRAGNFDAAIEKYQETLRSNPKNPDALAGLVRSYLKKKNVARAAEEAKTALMLSDSHAVLTAVAEVYFRQGQDQRRRERVGEGHQLPLSRCAGLLGGGSRTTSAFDVYEREEANR